MDQARVSNGETHAWWLVLLAGIASILLGVFVFIAPVATTVAIVWFIGLYWLMTAIVTLVSLFTDRSHLGWKLFSGLLSLVVGGWIVITPFTTTGLAAAEPTLAFLGATALIWAIGGIVVGIMQLAAAFQGGGWGIGVLGAFSLLIGILIAVNFYVAALAVPFVYGIFAIAGGIAEIIVSFRVRSAEHAMPVGPGRGVPA
ncbi:MAG: DUF308 domain-containing protein [Coriobacteriales bacterium]|nr:DUF308 domain-containing protein [Coriobacteriales bacterium]